MKKLKIIVLSRKRLIITASLSFISIILSISLYMLIGTKPANIFIDNKSGIIVIDPGHGGVDGGTNKDGILEKEINLDISKKLRVILEQKGYQVILTREEDVSLDNLDDTSSSRHQRDLNARAKIINNSNAQLFVSVHINCNLKKPSTDGSIVFYNDKFRQNEVLAYCIQRALNSVLVNGRERTIHNPQQANYFLLNYTKVPGAIVETAFISNPEERHLLTTDEFREQMAKAIAYGIERYLNESGNVFAPEASNQVYIITNKIGEVYKDERIKA